MKFDFYINRETGKIEAVSFKHDGNAHCTGDIREESIDELSVHFSDTTKNDDAIQDLMNRTVEKIGEEEGFNALLSVEIDDSELDFNVVKFGISAIYLQKKFIPTLEVNS